MKNEYILTSGCPPIHITIEKPGEFCLVGSLVNHLKKTDSFREAISAASFEPESLVFILKEPKGLDIVQELVRLTDVFKIQSSRIKVLID